ncbi:putative tartrate-resistant acid phosphatase type 5 [Trypanosoma conorhini]|uniref:Putative tartrate-resistant acid phosphatase type 5 n=1 Tax=Trypanosoma conorhini TaxID=83891 RepID=A0A422PTP0_9TRYP|nr:putative tartrate-resistant acid phosphatase type 5 [Trypanosoma conorhini]RNF20847.1 putative tartrate-resistant acid phosphatase type 5 [Trypanosoma conorhini]
MGNAVPLFRIIRRGNRSGDHDGHSGLLAREPRGALGWARVFLVMLSGTLLLCLVAFCSYRDGPSGPIIRMLPSEHPPQAGLTELANGTRFWLRGSWGRIVSVTDGCRAHPRFESFALACKSASGKLTSLVVMLELMPLLVIHGVHCKECHLPFSGQVEVEKTPAADLKQTEALSPRVVQNAKVTLPPLPQSCRRFRRDEKDEWGFGIQGLLPSDCMVRFDLLVSLSSHATEVAKAVPPICFAAIGDWGGATPNQGFVIKHLQRLMRRHWVKFLVSTGDNFYPSGVSSVRDQAWSTTFEKPFSDVAFQAVPFLISVGNHDLRGKLSAQIGYGKRSARWYFPASHYGASIPLVQACSDVTAGGATAVLVNDTTESCAADLLDMYVLNSYADGSWQQQVADGTDFFSRRLRGRNHRWRLVVNHETVFSGSMHGMHLARNRPFRRRALPFLAKHEIHMYLNGDDHLLEVHRYEETDFITSGAGGGALLYASFARLPTTLWRPEKIPGTDGNGEKFVLGFTLHCTVPFSDVLLTTLYNVNETHAEILYNHTTCYGRSCFIN